MTNTRLILISIFLVMLLAMLVMLCAKALAHHQGTTHRHHCGEETWNWHRHANWDLNTRRMHMSCGGLTVEEMEWVESRSGKESDCLGLARELGITTGYIPDVAHESTPAGPSMINEPCEDDEPPEEDPPAKKPPNKQPPVYTPSGDDNTLEETLNQVIDDEPVIPEELDDIIEELESPEVDDRERLSQTYRFHQGWNFKHFFVLPDSVVTLADLHRHLFPKLHGNHHLVVLIEGVWLRYSGEGETGEIVIAANMGVAVFAHKSFSVYINGYSRVGEINLSPGVHLIGVGGYERPSAIGAIAVVREIDGEFYAVGQAGDSGDAEFADDEAALVFVAATPQAPAAQRQGTLTMSWGAIKQER